VTNTIYHPEKLCSKIKFLSVAELLGEAIDRIHGENNISIDVVFVADDTIVHIYHREAEETMTYRLPDYSKNCLHNTALGKAYLSGLPDDLIAEKIDSMILTPARYLSACR